MSKEPGNLHQAFKNIHLRYFLLVIISFLVGVEFEFQSKLSKYLPYHNTFYSRQAEIKKVNVYVKAADEAVTEWRAYHMVKERIKEREKARQLAATMIPNYKLIRTEYLRPVWEIYGKYSYIYLLLICADIEGSSLCLEELLSAIKDVEELLESDISASEMSWLQGINLMTNLWLIKAQATAINFYRDDGSADKKREAMDALRQIGPQLTLQEQGLDKDRLLKQIYLFLYPTQEADQKPQETGYETPLKGGF
jgi:hypothetical protein